MKIVVGHKVLNLEELFNVSCLGSTQTEVVVDSQLYADLNKQAPKATIKLTDYKELDNVAGYKFTV